MNPFPKSIVLTGSQVMICIEQCLRSTFDDQAYEELDQRIGRGYQPDLRWDYIRDVDRAIRSVLRAHWTKRRKVAGEIGEPYRFDVFARILLSSRGVEEGRHYSVSTRWLPSFRKAIAGGGWRRAKTGALPEPWISNLKYTPSYIAWVESGGSEDLGLWLGEQHAFARRDSADASAD